MLKQTALKIHMKLKKKELPYKLLHGSRIFIYLKLSISDNFLFLTTNAITLV